IRHWNRWAQASLAGVLFLAVFILVQWPFAEFLLTPMARNWIFGAHYLMYSVHPDSASALHIFAQLEKTGGAFWSGMAIAVAASILSARVGLLWGDWMSRVKR
ncbi:MAG: hypothetical protein WB676_26245, partial [Bryobacteraceae bacterium]